MAINSNIITVRRTQKQTKIINQLATLRIYADLAEALLSSLACLPARFLPSLPAPGAPPLLNPFPEPTLGMGFMRRTALPPRGL